jgi:DNA processing protein
LARGIDASGHNGAVSSAARATIAVLGRGIDVVYPNENKKTFEQMEQRGAIIIGEFPIRTFPAPQISRFGTASLLAWRSGLWS